MTFHRVVVASDFSPAAEEAARVAVRVAAEDAVHRVVHVASLPPSSPFVGPSERELLDAALAREEEKATVRLDALAREAGARRVEARVLHGSVAREIAREADDLDADLIVVGARGHGLLDRILLGSTARGVLRATTRNVLVVRGRAPATGPVFPRIAVATDFGEASRRAGGTAAALALASGAALFAFHVVDPRPWGSLLKLPAEAAPKGKSFDEEWLRARMRELLERENAESLGGAARLLPATGEPAEAVRRLVADEGLALVVVGSHGPGAIERALLGSTAESVAESAPCSVLVARGR